MVPIERKAMIRDRSGLEPLFCQRPKDDMKSPGAPLGLDMIVDRPPSVRSGLEGPPTRTGSLEVESENVRHSELSSTECCSSTNPHSAHTMSPAAWSTTTSVAFRHSGHTVLFISWNLQQTTISGRLLLELPLQFLNPERQMCKVKHLCQPLPSTPTFLLHHPLAVNICSIKRKHPKPPLPDFCRYKNSHKHWNATQGIEISL